MEEDFDFGPPTCIADIKTVPCLLVNEETGDILRIYVRSINRHPISSWGSVNFWFIGDSKTEDEHKKEVAKRFLSV